MYVFYNKESPKKLSKQIVLFNKIPYNIVLDIIMRTNNEQ